MHEEIFYLISAIVGSGNVIVTPLEIIRYAGDHESGAFLSQMLCWSARADNPDKWIHKTYQEWENEVFLNEYRVREIAGKFEEAGILETKSENHDKTSVLYCRIKAKAFSDSFLNFLKGQKPSMNSDVPEDKTEDKAEETPVIETTAESPMMSFLEEAFSAATDELRSLHSNMAEPVAADDSLLPYDSVTDDSADISESDDDRHEGSADDLFKLVIVKVNNSIRDIITKYHRTHGFEYCKRNIEHINATIKDKRKYRAGLSKALENDAWSHYRQTLEQEEQVLEKQAVRKEKEREEQAEKVRTAKETKNQSARELETIEQIIESATDQEKEDFKKYIMGTPHWIIFRKHGFTSAAVKYQFQVWIENGKPVSETDLEEEDNDIPEQKEPESIIRPFDRPVSQPSGQGYASAVETMVRELLKQGRSWNEIEKLIPARYRDELDRLKQGRDVF
ncbi:MAG: hypothetical protein GY749_20450 [Desulfobacteraceae bacterium]|nr:hypothetical protein [Desulfobacteraceae bacterium]